MSTSSVVIIGLPSSGKTTFLAALWHVITARDVATKLSFANLKIGNAAHLNTIAARWREAKIQDRTSVSGVRLVSMNLVDDTTGQSLQITFPDVPGEAYRRMWEERDCEAEIAEILKSGDVLLFIHADTIRSPQWVVDEVNLSKEMGLDHERGEQPVAWHPSTTPTQVQLIDFLQMLRQPPLDRGPRRLAIMLSAWDKARHEGLNPREYLASKLPLLAQYLEVKAADWSWSVYGLSAQGGDYEDPQASDADLTKSAEELRKLDCASRRIQLVSETGETHDLTEPLAWLMER